MAQITIEVCDTCGNRNREVEKYTIKKGKKEVEKTLCAPHASALDTLLGERKPAGRKPAAATA